MDNLTCLLLPLLTRNIHSLNAKVVLSLFLVTGQLMSLGLGVLLNSNTPTTLFLSGALCSIYKQKRPEVILPLSLKGRRCKQAPELCPGEASAMHWENWRDKQAPAEVLGEQDQSSTQLRGRPKTWTGKFYPRGSRRDDYISKAQNSPLHNFAIGFE